MTKKQWQYLLLLPALLLVLTGCGSSSDDDDEDDLSAQCPTTSTITDADEVLTEIVYTSVNETADPNESLSETQAISLNNIVTGNLSWPSGQVCSDCDDFYSISSLTEGYEIEIELTAASGTNFDLLLHDGSSYSETSFDSTSNEKITYIVPSGVSSITLLVQSAITGSSGEYTLTVTSYDAATPITPSTSELNGKITDASSGDVLQGASIQLRACGEKTSDVLASDTSDASGNYNIDITTGTYTAEVSLDGYTSEFTTIALTADEDSIKNFPLNEQLAAGETRIVLSWGATPSDLDSHIQVPKATTGTTEISYRNRSEEGTALDVDDAGGFGPETITISTANTGTYTYWVQDYSNKGSTTSTALANSGAEVKVYNEDGLAKTFTVPSGAGNKWNVFTMNGDTGAITTVNTIE
jgi:hypothetical protein